MVNSFPLILSVFMVTTKDCNLNCSYCCAGDSSKESMSIQTAQETIEKIVRRIPESKTRFIWHGGEPTLQGLDFYRKVVYLENQLLKEGYVISNGLQTNGTLITEDWADFIKKNYFEISISLDGPQKIQDSMRRTINGKGSFEQIMKSTEILNRKGIKFGYVGVLTRETIPHLDATFDFFKNQGKNFKLNAVTPIGRAAKKNLTLNRDEFSDAYLHLYDRWLTEGDATFEKALMRYIGPLFSGRPEECNLLPSCQNSFLGIDPAGNAYPCARFCGNEDLFYGNLMTDSFEDIWNNPRRITLINLPPPESCSHCKYDFICSGDCPGDRYLTSIGKGINELEYKCHELYRLFSNLRERVIKDITKKD